MKYQTLIDNVNKLEKKIQRTEPYYFEAIQNLSEVRKDLSKLDIDKHLLRIVKVFLVKWGEPQIARNVSRPKLNWERLGSVLRNLNKDFMELKDRKFANMNFDDATISETIKGIYGGIRNSHVERLRGPTIASMTIHLFNPEVFVMWNYRIRQSYKKRNFRVCETPEGYLEFLKEAQKEIREALNDRKKETGRELGEVEKEIRGRYNNKTLARIIDEYNHSFQYPD